MEFCHLLCPPKALHEAPRGAHKMAQEAVIKTNPPRHPPRYAHQTKDGDFREGRPLPRQPRFATPKAARPAQRAGRGEARPPWRKLPFLEPPTSSDPSGNHGGGEGEGSGGEVTAKRAAALSEAPSPRPAAGGAARFKSGPRRNEVASERAATFLTVARWQVAEHFAMRRAPKFINPAQWHGRRRSRGERARDPRRRPRCRSAPWRSCSGGPP